MSDIEDSLTISRFSSKMEVLTACFDNINAIRMRPGNPPKVSIMDFVGYVTSHDNKAVSNLLIRLQTDLSADSPILYFWNHCEKFKFPGARQKDQYILSCTECNQLIMMLPGRNAMEFRQKAAHLLTRFFAGDPTLHDVITANELSDGAVNQFARAELQSQKEVLVDQDADEVAMIKQIRMGKLQVEINMLQVETSNLQAEAGKRKAEIIHERIAFMEDIKLKYLSKAPPSQMNTLNESMRNYVVSCCYNVMSSDKRIENGEATDASAYTNDDTPITISTHILQPRKIQSTPAILLQMGFIAGRLYKEKYGVGPRKEYVGTYYTNQYTMRDMPLFDATFEEYHRTFDDIRVQEEKKTARNELKRKGEADLDKARRVAKGYFQKPKGV
jgi:hypothetical protein